MEYWKHENNYDALYQITRATHPSVQNPVAELVEAEQFQYDEVGNWLNGPPSLGSFGGQDGNMTRKVTKSTNDPTEFIYDIEIQLIKNSFTPELTH